MIDYEGMILDMADIDNDIDECVYCQYKGNKCKSQCEQVVEIYNPVLKFYLDK